jgi:hypothetical protein
MKIKHLLNLTVVFLAIALVSCDDDLNSIGGNIQPGGDDISIYVDTVVLTARTVSMVDSIYARSESGLLGEYNDPVFGKIKSDFLSEFYNPDSLSFHAKTTSIDSVFLDMVSPRFFGDTISPIGIAAYRIDKKPLERNFFTNINPTDYCSMQDIWGQGIFTIKDAERFGSDRRYRFAVRKSIGDEFYNEWKNSDGKTFLNSASLRNYLKGIYVTTTLGSGSLIDMDYTALQIYYSYTGRNLSNTADSTRVGLFRLVTNRMVIQLNRVQNSIPENLFENSDSRVYMKTPAGICAELTIPLKEIMDKAKKEGRTNRLNSAGFFLKGYTEEEEKSNMQRSNNLLFINKDSLPNFFFNNKEADAKTSFVMMRNPSTNSYNFSNSNTTSVSNNLANMVNYYVDYYKDKETVPDLKFMVIPVSAQASQVVNSGLQMYTRIYNLMTPTSTILRTDEDNMKMALIFSNYNVAR